MNTADTNRAINYAIGLILYNPGEQIIKRIELMIDLGVHLYIFDNSPFSEISNAILDKYGDIQYITTGTNIGVARALSVLCATAYARGHHKLLFLDQDTGVNEQTLNFIDEYSKALTVNEQESLSAVVFCGNKQDNLISVDVTVAISSGSLFMLDILRRIGWHNSSYFVDCVDYEFCVRSAHNGYKIRLVYKAPGFDHVSEQPDHDVYLFGKRLLIRCYSFARIKDALIAYTRLLAYTVRIARTDLFLLIAKSMLIYITGQLIARFTTKRL